VLSLGRFGLEVFAGAYPTNTERPAQAIAVREAGAEVLGMSPSCQTVRSQRRKGAARCEMIRVEIDGWS
jgi:hypothetical protein